MLPDISEEHLHFQEMLLLQEFTPQRFRDDARRKIYELAWDDLPRSFKLSCYMDCFTGECFIPHTTVGTDPDTGVTRYFGTSSGTDPQGTGVTRYFTSSGTVPTIPG